MKGLKSIPNVNDFKHAYEVLEMTPSEAGLDEIVRWSQWVRFDPRLGEILIRYLSAHWVSINPLQLNAKVIELTWPAVWGVILEQLQLVLKQDESLEKRQVTNFKLWKNIVLSAIPVANGHEQFFIGLLKPGSKRMQNEAANSLTSYRKWGYLGTEVMINKFAAHPHTHLPCNRRMELLEEIINRVDHLSVNEYMHQLDFKVSRRQAQRDLEKHPRLKPTGHTRGRIYKVYGRTF